MAELAGVFVQRFPRGHVPALEDAPEADKAFAIGSERERETRPVEKMTLLVGGQVPEDDAPVRADGQRLPAGANCTR